MTKRQVLFTALAFVAGSLIMSSTAAAGSVGTVPDDGCISYLGAIFCDDDLRSTGTGTFDPFLLNNGGGSQPVTSAWNTDATTSQLNQDTAQPNMAQPSNTSSLCPEATASAPDCAVIATSSGNDTYWTFIVDVNQLGSTSPDDTSSLIDLTHLQLYWCPTNDYTSLTGCTSFYNLFGGAVTYDENNRDAPVISDTDWITFDYRLHTGSGSGDVIVFLPTSMFDFVPTTGFVALLDGWGSTEHINNDGFEEWKVIEGFDCPSGCGGGTAATPEPATFLFVGSGLAVAVRRLRKQKP